MNQDKKPKSLFAAFGGSLFSKNYGTFAFYAALLAAVFFLISLPVCPWAQQKIMEKFHLRSPSFLQWGLLQTIPSMYNFANEITVSAKSLDSGDEFKKLQHYWVNHYPLRYLTFSLTNRRDYQKLPARFRFLVISRYQGRQMETLYELDPPRLKRIEP